MTTPKLLLCPFCGANAHIVPNGRWHIVQCDDCGIATEVCARADAVETWNRRAPLTIDDAMTVPEVRALVRAARLSQGDGWERAHVMELEEALRPF
jgi:Lar family restriction alleviation protein